MSEREKTISYCKCCDVFLECVLFMTCWRNTFKRATFLAEKGMCVTSVTCSMFLGWYYANCVCVRGPGHEAETCRQVKVVMTSTWISVKLEQ